MEDISVIEKSPKKTVQENSDKGQQTIQEETIDPVKKYLMDKEAIEPIQEIHEKKIFHKLELKFRMQL